MKGTVIKEIIKRVEKYKYDWMKPEKPIEKMDTDELRNYADLVSEFDYVKKDTFDIIPIDDFDPSKAYDTFFEWKYDSKIKKDLTNEFIRRTGDDFNRLYTHHHYSKDDWGGDLRWKFLTTDKNVYSEWSDFMWAYHLLAAIKSKDQKVIIDAICGFYVYWDIVSKDVPNSEEINKKIHDTYVDKALKQDFDLKFSLEVLKTYEKDVERRKKNL